MGMNHQGLLFLAKSLGVVSNEHEGASEEVLRDLLLRQVLS